MTTPKKRPNSNYFSFPCLDDEARDEEQKNDGDNDHESHTIKPASEKDETTTFSYTPDPVSKGNTSIEISISSRNDSGAHDNHTSQYKWEKYSNGFASKQR